MIEIRDVQTIINASTGNSDAYLDAGFALPKNQIEIEGSTLISRAVRSYVTNIDKGTVVLSKAECVAWQTHEHLRNEFESLGIEIQNEQGSGALCTALLASDRLNLDLPLLIASGDSFNDFGLEHFVKSALLDDAKVATQVFRSSHPRWSYVRTAAESKILEVAEKRPISNLATTGVFFFASARIFMDAAAWVLTNNIQTRGKYFVSQTLNYAILNNLRATCFATEATSYHPFGLPSDYINYFKRMDTSGKI